MQLMRQATLAVACMALSATALAQQVQGIYLTPDTASKDKLTVAVIECEKFNPNVQKPTQLKCTAMPYERIKKDQVPKKKDLYEFGFWVNKFNELCWRGPWGPIGCAIEASRRAAYGDQRSDDPRGGGGVNR